MGEEHRRQSVRRGAEAPALTSADEIGQLEPWADVVLALDGGDELVERQRDPASRAPFVVVDDVAGKSRKRESVGAEDPVAPSDALDDRRRPPGAAATRAVPVLPELPQDVGVEAFDVEVEPAPENLLDTADDAD